ncbi:MAG: glycosyltransferase family 4 protein [Hyphomicrobiales bacterium]
MFRVPHGFAQPLDEVDHERSRAATAPLRIAMVSARYLPFMGGTEAHVHEVTSRLARLGHSVTILTTDPTEKLPQEESVAGVRIVRVRTWFGDADYYYAPGIYRNLTEGDWDLVHIQGYHTFVAPLAMLAAIRKRVPFVLTFHSGGHSSRLRKALRKLQSALLSPLVRRAHQLIGVSEFEAEFFSKSMGVPRSRFVVVPNGAHLPAAPSADQSSDHRLIISIGRLEKYKGHHRAIEAMPKLLWRFPDLQLRVLGTGPYEGELRVMVRKLRLDRHVTIGAIPPSERQALASLLSRAAVVVLLSEYEAHPVAVMEALYLRRKVLTSDTSGFRELAEKGLVRTVSLQSTTIEIASAIADELTAPPQSADFVLPDWSQCAAKLDDIYKTVVQRAA